MGTPAKELAAEVRRARRHAEARPLLARFRRRLDERADAVLPKGPIGEGDHLRAQAVDRVTRYREDGDLAIDNNAAERALRRVVTGRKNWLFCGSDAGGTRGDPL